MTKRVKKRRDAGQTKRNRGTIEFKAAADGAAEIYIYGDIGDDWYGGVTDVEFAKELAALGDVDQIDVRINSAGGSVFQGFAIYSLLRAHKAEITVHVDGLAASIASVIAMAGDTVRLSDRAMMMIHNPWTITVGGAEQLRKDADLLDKLAGQIAGAYLDRVTIDADAVTAAMDAETWYTAAEAVEIGLADETFAESKAAAAAWDLSRFVNVPQSLLEQDAGPTDDIAAIVAAKQADDAAAEAVAVRLRLVDVAEQSA